MLLTHGSQRGWLTESAARPKFYGLSDTNGDGATVKFSRNIETTADIRAHSLICRGGLSSASGGNSEVDSGSGGLLAQVLY